MKAATIAIIVMSALTTMIMMSTLPVPSGSSS